MVEKYTINIGVWPEQKPSNSFYLGLPPQMREKIGNYPLDQFVFVFFIV